MSAREYRVVKTEGERRYTLGVVYPVKETDTHGDTMTAADLEEAAWRYLVESREVGVMHADGTGGAGAVVESYIYRGPTWEVGGERVDPGDWLAGVIWSEEAWAEIKAGRLVGFSLQGWARHEPGPASKASGGFSERPRTQRAFKEADTVSSRAKSTQHEAQDEHRGGLSALATIRKALRTAAADRAGRLGLDDAENLQAELAAIPDLAPMPGVLPVTITKDTGRVGSVIFWSANGEIECAGADVVAKSDHPMFGKGMFASVFGRRP